MAVGFGEDLAILLFRHLHGIDAAVLELQGAAAQRAGIGRCLVRQHGGEVEDAAGLQLHRHRSCWIDPVRQDLAVDGVVVSERTESVAAWQTCIQPLSMVVSSRAIQAVATLYRGSQLK